MTIIREISTWAPSSSIERFDASKRAEGWANIDIPVSPLTPRRTPGVIQTSSTEILIFGGFAQGKELKASYRFNVHTQTITKYMKGSEITSVDAHSFSTLQNSMIKDYSNNRGRD